MATRTEQAMQAFTERLTENQRKLVREQLLVEALTEAERSIAATTKYRLMPHWSLMGMNKNDPQRGINQAVFWCHAKLGHLWKVNEDGKTVMVGSNEL